ncbi:MAG: hypothetical protein Q4A21_02520 [bacterium]|nr:hypothetical protein [bacterium]
MEENTQKVVEIRKGENDRVIGGQGVSQPVFATVERKKYSQTVKTIRQTVIWFNIFTATICAIVSLVNIWLDNSLESIMGKSWATFLVLGAFSVVIMLIAPLLDKDSN